MFHLLFPAIATYGYLNLPKNELRRISPTIINCVSFVHNLGLHMFSLYEFVGLVNVLYNHGIVAGRGFYFDINGVDHMVLLCCLSKYYEYMDTVILYSKGKSPIFLQKFHHIGATFVWHLGYMYRFDGIFFASVLNSGVHSIMYFYYLLTLFPNLRKRISGCKIYITSLQIGQLVFGAWALPWFYYNLESNVNKRVIWITDIYIGILLLLFGNFMFDNYFGRKNKSVV
jgi:hypothetical protein